MSLRLSKNRRHQWVLVAALAALVLPYIFSRLVSPWRVVSLHSTTVAEHTELPVTQLRIISYNIAHGRGVAVSNWDGGDREQRTERLARIAELLRKLDADIVVLNEVDFDSSWSHSVNQALFLAESAKYPYWAEQRNLDFRLLAWKWRFGNVVLSRWPITNARAVDLPGYALWETVLAGKKRAVMCDVAAGEQKVSIVGVHLSHRSEELRVRSAIMLAEIVAENDLPTIIAGDLNSTPPGFPYSVSDQHGNNAIASIDKTAHLRRFPTIRPTVNDDLTFHSAKPRSVIDWILIPRNWKFLQYSVELSQLSDHRPVCADVAPACSVTRPFSDEFRNVER